MPFLRSFPPSKSTRRSPTPRSWRPWPSSILLAIKSACFIRRKKTMECWHASTRGNMANEILCPSASCKSGAQLLGIVLGNGAVDMLPVPLEIDDAFVVIAQEGRRPEKRFRFTAPCLEAGCQQWHDGRCGVIDRCSTEIAVSSTLSSHIQRCAIRPLCRWFRQDGAAACRICPEVVTDPSEGWVGDFDSPIAQGTTPDYP